MVKSYKYIEIKINLIKIIFDYEPQQNKAQY